MNSTGKSARATKRLASAAVAVGSTVAVLASPLAVGTASAATARQYSALSIASNSQNQGLNAGASASFTVDYTTSTPFQTGDSVPPMYLTFTGSGGPDYSQASYPTGLASSCVVTPPANNSSSGSATCSFTNNGTSGVDTIEAFGDNSNSTHKATDSGNVVSSPTSVTFSGAINSVQIDPTSSVSSTGTCVVYTVTAKDSGGFLAGDRTVNVTVAEPNATSPTFTHYDGNCANPVSGGSFSLGTGSNGTVAFGVSSNKAGVGTVTVANPGATASASASATWNGVDNGGANNVSQLAVSPASTSDYTYQSETFTVTATDSSGHAVQGVTVNEAVTGGADSAGTCAGATSQTGKTTCSITNAGTATTDGLRFWVNQTAPTPSGCSSVTGGFDSGCEPFATASSVFTAPPAAGTTLSVTCPDETNGGQASTTCTVPAGQHTVVYSATVKDASSRPLSGAVVTFVTSGTGTAANPPTTTPLGGQVTTGADGVAAFTVTSSTAANADVVTVTATIGNPAHGGFGPAAATATWQTRHASALTLSPQVQTVTKGGTVSLTAHVVDQFGTGVSAQNQLEYSVSGRNNKNLTIVNTDATGSAAISYPDGTSVAGSTDTITVQDDTNPSLNNQPSDIGTVKWIDGSNTAAAVSVDTSGLGTNDAGCQPGATGHSPAGSTTPLALGTQTIVCAIVKNSNNPAELLAGKSVTFTVSNGQVDSKSGVHASSTTTYVATTDANGVAFAAVKSFTTGSQTVTATADSVTGSGTVTYAAPTASQALKVTASPASVIVAHGTSQKFVFTVTDQYGNGVPGVVLSVTQHGAGILTVGSGSQTTDSSGQVSALLGTQPSDSGSGTVTAQITTGGTQCGTTGGACSAIASYTVGAATIAVAAAPGGKVGHAELVGATIKNPDGTPIVGVLVRFTVAGANDVTASGTTNANGVALMAYTPHHAGKDTILASADSLGLQGSGTTTIRAVTEKPTITLSSRNGKVTIHVTSHPSLAHTSVTYYVKHLGHYRKIGSNETGSAGRAHKSFKKKVGVQHTYRVKVTGKSGVASGKSAPKSIRTRG